MDNKAKLDIAIGLLRMARAQLNLEHHNFNSERFKEEIIEARRLQADVLRSLKNYSLFKELRENEEE